MEPWLVKLSEGDTQAAWDLFDARYRRLMLATIRRLVPDRDDLMDVFGTLCQALSADDFARLKRYSLRGTQRASVATWLVAVVRNLTVDWLRQRDGRRRSVVPSDLSPLQQNIFEAICLSGYSPIEAYELLRAKLGFSQSFHEFLRDVRETNRLAPCPDQAPVRPVVRGVTSPSETAAPIIDPAETADSAARLAVALTGQPPDIRLAVELFVVERMPAADVARVLGWPNAKTVYNRVYRALISIRAELEQKGIGPGDL